MNSITFAKRNFKELVRDPLSSLFFIIFPVLLFVVLKVIMNSVGASVEDTPQFGITHMTSGMIIFAFSFMTIFVSNTISLDRDTAFLTRLKSTPMKVKDFVLGYTLPYIPIALIIEVLMIITGLCFKLEFSINIIWMALLLFPFSLFFIGLGILIGVSLNSKACGPFASIMPTAVGLIGGIFFPLDLITNGFSKLCYALPFANMIKVGDMVCQDSFSIARYIVIGLTYTVIVYIISSCIFVYRIKHDKI